eukprot:scaffold292381_cov17-Tisochrysis_lutea.AAC.1
MATTPLAPAAGYNPKYSQGFLANLEEVRVGGVVLPRPSLSHLPPDPACTLAFEIRLDSLAAIT